MLGVLVRNGCNATRCDERAQPPRGAPLTRALLCGFGRVGRCRASEDVSAEASDILAELAKCAPRPTPQCDCKLAVPYNARLLQVWQRAWDALAQGRPQDRAPLDS